MIQSALESVVEAFEQDQRRLRTPAIKPFVARVPAEEQARVAVELIRSDIEFRWENNLPTRDVESYRQEFAEILTHPERLREVAFEDCRQRVRKGQSVDVTRYAKQFGIDVSEWHFEPPATGSRRRHGLPPNNEYLQSIYDHFSDFVPLLELGRGAAGRVYLAAQGDLAERLVALKVTNEPNFEPLQLAQLQHSNIVPIYSVHRHEEWQAVCMPFMGHFTLNDLLKHSHADDRSRRGRDLLSTVAQRTQETIRNQVAETDLFSEPSAMSSPAIWHTSEMRFMPDLGFVETCVWLASRIAAGLAHAHRRGIVHSDMKPSNILIGHEGEPLILDFHLAHRLSSERPQFIGGTLPYMSADHLQALDQGDAPTEECDVYSLGVILYQMLTGKLPYPVRGGALPDAIGQMIADRQKAPDPPSKVNALISPDVDAVVLKCLSPDARRGYSSAAQLETDLQRHLDFFPPKYARSYSLKERGRKWLSRHPGVRSASFIGLAAALLLTAVVSWASFRAYRDARNLAESKFANAERELGDLSATLASAVFGQPNFSQGLAQAKSQLQRLEIPEWEPPSWEIKLSAESRDLLHRHLGEVHYLLADNYLEIARAAPTESERTSQLERARAHHKTADGLFAGGPAPFVLQWQTEQLRSQPDSTGGSNWKNFAQWLKTTKLDQAASTNWLDQRLLAMECYQQGDYRTALKLLEEGLKHHATDYPGWLVLGNCYAQAKNLEKADVCYLVCLTLRPDSSDTYLSRALARIDQKAFKDALADLNRCLELRPGDPYFFANRGVCHFNLGDMKSAEADLSQAIELGATETRLYFFRSMVRKALGDGPGAETDLATGLKLTPSDTDSWLSRGFYLVETDPQQALDNFQNAIRLSPRSATAWENCAALYAGKLNDLTKAIECMDELLRIEPENAKHWASRGALHARNNQPDKAMADAADALKLSTSPETLYRVGSLYARLSEKHPEHTAKAINLIRAAASKDPRFVLRYLKNPAGQLADEDLKPIFEIPEFKEFYDRFVWLMTPPSPK